MNHTHHIVWDSPRGRRKKGYSSFELACSAARETANDPASRGVVLVVGIMGALHLAKRDDPMVRPVDLYSIQSVDHAPHP